VLVEALEKSLVVVAVLVVLVLAWLIVVPVGEFPGRLVGVVDLALAHRAIAAAAGAQIGVAHLVLL
jgi:hypothetical protein